jgi:hypothetical protein
VIDLAEGGPDVVAQIGQACREWGFFQVFLPFLEWEKIVLAFVVLNCFRLFESKAVLMSECSNVKGWLVDMYAGCESWSAAGPSGADTPNRCTFLRKAAGREACLCMQGSWDGSGGIWQPLACERRASDGLERLHRSPFVATFSPQCQSMAC